MHFNLMDHFELRTHQKEQQEDVHLPKTDLMVTEVVDLRCASYIGLTPALLHHTTTIPYRTLPYWNLTYQTVPYGIPTIPEPNIPNPTIPDLTTLDPTILDPIRDPTVPNPTIPVLP